MKKIILSLSVIFFITTNVFAAGSSSSGSSGNDVYSYTIIKTGDAAYTVLANVANFA